MKRLSGLFARLRTSLITRYALSYISVIALVLSGLFGYMYFYVATEVRDKAIDNHVNRLNRVVYQHENYMDTMLNTAVQIGLSPFIEAFDFETTPSKAYDLLRQMAPYTVTNGFCDQMYLTFAGDNHIYSSTSSMTLSMFADLVDYEHLTDEALLDLLHDPGRLTVIPAQQIDSPLLDVQSNTNMVTFLVPLGSNINNSMGTMVFYLKERLYWEMFADAIEDNNNTYIFHGGQVLASAVDFEIPPDVIAALLEPRSASIRKTFFYGGEDWQLLSIGNRDWDMQYVTVLRTADLASSIWSSMWGLILLLIILALMGVAIALIMARRNARPIQEISSMLPHTAGKDELSSIQAGIRELTSRTSDLTTRLERSLPMQRHDFVLRFMKGRYASREEAAAAAAPLGMMIDKRYYAVILSGVQEHNDQPMDLRRPPFDALSGIIGCGVELMALNVHMYLVFADEPAQIRALAQLLQEVTIEHSGHAIVAISGIQTDFACAPTAYLEAATAYDNRFVMDENGLLDYSTISTSIEDIMPQARKLTDGINQALLLRNERMLSGKIDELLHFLKHTSMAPFVFRLIYNDVIDTLMREHMDALARDRNMQELYDIFSLSSFQNIGDLDALLRQLCGTIMSAEDGPTEVVQAEEPTAIHQVISYINDHFADPELSISAIAEAFDMPTARLSLAFKDMTRMSPLEYLSLLRVEHSKGLLARSELSIKEIAAQVGYYDASSFIRRFKQMTGVTPLQYRRSKENEEHDTHVDL